MTTFHQLTTEFVDQAVALDAKWFGLHGISNDSLNQIINISKDNTLGIFEDNTLKGFAVWEILDNELPIDYLGIDKIDGRVMFIQQFTTATNYAISDWHYDELLLGEIESLATTLEVEYIWEALSIDHPYSQEVNDKYDAYGFYLSHGYTITSDNPIWSPSEDISIKCRIFQKVLK